MVNGLWCSFLSLIHWYPIGNSSVDYLNYYVSELRQT